MHSVFIYCIGRHMPSFTWACGTVLHSTKNDHCTFNLGLYFTIHCILFGLFKLREKKVNFRNFYIVTPIILTKNIGAIYKWTWAFVHIHPCEVIQWPLCFLPKYFLNLLHLNDLASVDLHMHLSTQAVLIYYNKRALPVHLSSLKEIRWVSGAPICS